MTIERVKGAKIGGEKHEKQKDGQTKHVTDASGHLENKFFLPRGG